MLPMREDLLRIAPELVLCLTGILLMVIEPFLTRQRAARAGLRWRGPAQSCRSQLRCSLPCIKAPPFPDCCGSIAFSIFFHVLIGMVALLVVLASSDYLEREHIQHGEYYALVLFAAAGMGVMASAAELMTAFVGLEVSSISTYILAGYRRDAPGSNEAAMKYFLLGSFATAFFLYGVALLYGATGTTRLDQMTPTALAGCAGTVPPRTGAGAGGARIQGGRRAVSDVDARRVPGRADAGDARSWLPDRRRRRLRCCCAFSSR